MLIKSTKDFYRSSALTLIANTIIAIIVVTTVTIFRASLIF